MAFQEEKKNIDITKERLKESQEKNTEQKNKILEERKTILEAVAKLGFAEKKFAAKIKDFEDIAEVRKNFLVRLLNSLRHFKLFQTCNRIRQDCRAHLNTSQHLTGDRKQVLKDLKTQLGSLAKIERQIEEKKKLLNQERKRLWNTRSSVVCSQCQVPMVGGPVGVTTTALDPDTITTVGGGAGGFVVNNRSLGDGQHSIVGTTTPRASIPRPFSFSVLFSDLSSG